MKAIVNHLVVIVGGGLMLTGVTSRLEASHHREAKKTKATAVENVPAPAPMPALPEAIRQGAMGLHPDGLIVSWVEETGNRARPDYLVQMLMPANEVRDLTVNLDGLVLMDSKNLLQTDAIAALPKAVVDAAVKTAGGGRVFHVDAIDAGGEKTYDVFVLRKDGRAEKVPLRPDGSPGPKEVKPEPHVASAERR